MKRLCTFLTTALIGIAGFATAAWPQTCTIGGHNETSENFAATGGGWTTALPTPGTVPGGLSGTHLLISEVGVRGASLAAAGGAPDSSEFVEIYNPTTKPVSLDGKYLSDDIGYYKVVNGPFAVANTSDFALKFPAGLSLNPGRTAVVCVTKTGFAASGASAPGAQYFLEMTNTNGNTSDDMVNVATGSVFPVTGGMFTNPSATNGEWVMLFCWDGVSDRVCDVDYASWGATSPSNPKMDKTGISIDGPDAGAIASAFLPDTPAASQSNLGSGTALARPGTYQRTAGEVGEIPTGGNGCVGVLSPTAIDWLPVSGTTDIKFHIRWQNLDNDAMSPPISGSMSSQEFGVFLPDAGQIGQFNVPPLQPSSFFDVFFEVPLSSLPPAPQKLIGGSGGVPALAASMRHRGPATLSDCPPDTNWAGNVDIQWSGSGQSGQVNRHYADLLTCAGGAPSYIHFRPSNCTSPMPWSLVGVCPGFTVTLVNENLTPAPNPVPVGWSGFISITAAGSVPSGASCCFGVVFQCNGATATINICSTACQCGGSHPPTLSSVDWTNTGSTVHFHQHWTNPDAGSSSGPVSGTMNSQALGVFLPDFGPIGPFSVPAIAPSSFFDVFLDIDRSQLPPEPALTVPGSTAGTPNPCVTDHWHGNVNITWNGTGGPGQAFKHFGEMPVCPGAAPTTLFIETDCQSAVGASWTIAGLCPGFSATLLNTDLTPAPNPVPPGWVGLLAVQAPAGTPIPTTCCFKVVFTCNGTPGVIDVCAYTCNCGPKKPVLGVVDWARVAGTSSIRFHMRWSNPDANNPTDPVSGTMHSQQFGVFLPDAGTIGTFDVPPIQPSSFFDVFIEVPLAQLPPQPQERLPGGGPAPGSPCPPDTSWSGNVDINWNGPGGSGQVGRHFTQLLVRPGSGSSHIHTLVFCNNSAGATWSIAGLCPGWNATLLNENFTPAPNPVPPGWTGWISVAIPTSAPNLSCCFSVTFVCDGVPGTIDVCAEQCQWANADVLPNLKGVDFGIYAAAPNPARNGMVIAYAMSKAGNANLAVYTLGGQRVRTLVSGTVQAGMSSVRWDGRGEGGRPLPAGAYFVRLASGERVSSRKIVLFR